MTVDKQVGKAIDPILKTVNSALLAKFTDQMVKIYLAASVEMMTYGKTKLGIPIPFEGPPTKEAIAYAESHCAEMVTLMDEETKRRIAQVVSDGIKHKRGVDGIARDLKNMFIDMSRSTEMTASRARMIARTESSDALSQAFMDRAEDLKIGYKQVFTSDPCDICRGNAAEGIVPIDHVFQSGHKKTPFHPNCVCSLAPALKP